jgi:hypothetical protein
MEPADRVVSIGTENCMPKHSRLSGGAPRRFQAPYTFGLTINDWLLSRPAKAIVTHHRRRHPRAAPANKGARKTRRAWGDVNGYITFSCSKLLCQ